ncbi:MAG: glycosyltransferase family 2 protein [Defluviitaleaceae bacterium]|nr:glycosyltransferase family 2 protein [Defluviitaleaceae bacterium]
MTNFFEQVVFFASIFFIVYLLIYATFTFMAVAVGAYNLRARDRMQMLKNELKHTTIPISIIVPAYNEAAVIVNSIRSLLALDYRHYEIVVVDDHSADNTSQLLIDEFNMKPYNRPINSVLECKPHISVHEQKVGNVNLTLIRKHNGGKSDALNMGINACRYPYFICMDADSFLQKDSLEKIVQPILEDDTIVSVGGMILVSQCVQVRDGMAVSYKFPPSLLVSMQAVEYDRTFLGSRILFDTFNGNLIISGAFGLFKKSLVIAAGGYDVTSLGEDMELALKTHVYCRNNSINYRMRYTPGAVCLTQAPSRLKDLVGQRRRWHIGMFQSMRAHWQVFLNLRFGMVSFLSFMYYLLYELLSPLVELFGVVSIVLAAHLHLLNVRFMVVFLILYVLYGVILSLCIYTQHIYQQRFKLSALDLVKALLVCLLEFTFFRYLLVFTRFQAFLMYRKHKRVWGTIKRD